MPVVSLPQERVMVLVPAAADGSSRGNASSLLLPRRWRHLRLVVMLETLASLPAG